MSSPYIMNANIAIVAVDERSIEAAKLAVTTLISGKANVFFDESLNDYASCFGLKESNPDLTIFIDYGESKIVPVKVQNNSQTKTRNIDKSQDAKEYFAHYARMKGEMPDLLGAYKLDWSNVKYFDWFVKNDSAMIYIKTKLSDDDLTYVIENGVSDYIKYKEQQEREESEKSDDNCNTCLEGAVTR